MDKAGNRKGSKGSRDNRDNRDSKGNKGSKDSKVPSKEPNRGRSRVALPEVNDRTNAICRVSYGFKLKPASTIVYCRFLATNKSKFAVVQTSPLSFCNAQRRARCAVRPPNTDARMMRVSNTLCISRFLNSSWFPGASP